MAASIRRTPTTPDRWSVRLNTNLYKLSGFLLRHGCHYHRPAWTQLHWRWLASLRFVAERGLHRLAAHRARQTHVLHEPGTWQRGAVMVSRWSCRQTLRTP